jgi:hypothetical protein
VTTKAEPPLQAADLLAWYQRRVYHDTNEALNAVAEGLFGRIHHYREFWTEQRLQDAANKVIVNRFAGIPEVSMTLPQRLRVFDTET